MADRIKFAQKRLLEHEIITDVEDHYHIDTLSEFCSFFASQTVGIHFLAVLEMLEEDDNNIDFCRV
jgi:hypothetical protein